MRVPCELCNQNFDRNIKSHEKLCYYCWTIKMSKDYDNLLLRLKNITENERRKS